MKTRFDIFVPELVPLANKGEEAIIRGIADVLFPSGDCEIHLLDEVDQYTRLDGIHVYPVSWFISPWMNREFGLGASWTKIRDSFSSLVRNALHLVIPSWVKIPCRALRRTERRLRKLDAGADPRTERDRQLAQILNCDFVLVGHDGALDERVCHIVDEMRSHGTEAGVFGVELPAKLKSKQIQAVMQNTLRHMRFFYCRTQASQDTAQRVFGTMHAKLLPDPAFGMRPSNRIDVESLIRSENLEDLFEKPVILCTSCEPGPISRHCFEDIVSPGAKLHAHRKLFGSLVRHIVSTLDVNILFVPHAVGPGAALDDRRVARAILKYSGVPESRARALDSAHPAKLLKGLIGRGELLIAERIHSMIGAVGVATPFLCLGSELDRRIKGIIDQMTSMGDCVYFLNRPSESELISKFNDVWSRRAELRVRLSRTNHRLCDDLENAAEVMREAMMT